MKIEIHIDDKLARPIQSALQRRFMVPGLILTALLGTGVAMATTFLGPLSDGEVLTAQALNDRFDQLYDAIADVEGKAASSGVYLPTPYSITSMSNMQPYEAQWLRVGNVVTVSGRVDFTTVGTGSEFELTYPFATNAENSNRGGGTGSDGNNVV